MGPDPDDESDDSAPLGPPTGWVWSVSAGWIEVEAEQREHWDDARLWHDEPPR